MERLGNEKPFLSHIGLVNGFIIGVKFFNTFSSINYLLLSDLDHFGLAAIL